MIRRNRRGIKLQSMLQSKQYNFTPNPMAHGREQRSQKEDRKKPQKTLKEKRQEKRQKESNR